MQPATARQLVGARNSAEDSVEQLEEGRTDGEEQGSNRTCALGVETAATGGQ